MLDQSDREFLTRLLKGPAPFEDPGPYPRVYAEGQPPLSRFVLRCPFCLDESELVIDRETAGWAVTDPARAMIVVTAWMRQHADQHRDCAVVEGKAGGV